MTTGAIIMMVLGMSVTWGGAIFCLRRAMNNKEEE